MIKYNLIKFSYKEALHVRGWILSSVPKNWVFLAFHQHSVFHIHPRVWETRVAGILHTFEWIDRFEGPCLFWVAFGWAFETLLVWTRTLFSKNSSLTISFTILFIFQHNVERFLGKYKIFQNGLSTKKIHICLLINSELKIWVQKLYLTFLSC